MNKYIIGTTKNPRDKQRRAVQMKSIERIQQKKKVSFKMKERESIFDDVNAVEECREMFRKEIFVLGQEVVKFRETCENELSRYKSKLEQEIKQRAALLQQTVTKEITDMQKNKHYVNGVVQVDPTAMTKMWTEKLNSLQEDMDHLARKQSQIDRETMLADVEESLFERKAELEKYEKEIEEIESGLDRRQEMCQKRQHDLLSMEEELDKLKLDLEQKKESLHLLGVDSSDVNSHAKRNWEHTQNNLLEKQSFLQTKVNQYRTELATLKSTCTAKDISILKLQTQVDQLQENLQQKDAKIEQLNTQLTLLLEEAKEKESKSKLSRNNSIRKVFSRQASLKSQSSKDNEERDKLDSLPQEKMNRHRKTVRHPMRQSVDVTHTGFQMGIQPPSSDESRACVVM